MSDNIKITDTPDGGAIVEMDGETIRYSKEEIEEMERDYVAAIRRALANQKGATTA
jgi:glutamate dehydrogenase/leucine dehydrogenase